MTCTSQPKTFILGTNRIQRTSVSRAISVTQAINQFKKATAVD